MAQNTKPANNMMKFVGIIFLTALVLGGLYFFLLTPASPDRSTLAPPQEGTLEQHVR